MHAESALLAMSGRQPDAGSRKLHARDPKHVMLSYQWDVQEVVKRIVNELQVRGYRTWFGAHRSRLLTLMHRAVDLSPQPLTLACARVSDLDNMKGSTVDSMSDAIDNAEAMLSCISLAYKESASEQTSAAVLRSFAVSRAHASCSHSVVPGAQTVGLRHSTDTSRTWT